MYIFLDGEFAISGFNLPQLTGDSDPVLPLQQEQTA
jgi:hypothetical protein|tara:strand:- start:312 stop:419 length:108 start_codon:yes stop_codon:yes gene_type:complete